MNLRKSLKIKRDDYTYISEPEYRVKIKRVLRRNGIIPQDLNFLDTQLLEELVYPFKKELKI